VDSAGPRYTPQANVDVPINDAFEALQREPRFFTALAELGRDLERARGYLLDEQERFGQVPELRTRLKRLVLRTLKMVEALRAVPSEPAAELPLRALSRRATRLDADAEAVANQLYRETRGLPDDDAGRARGKVIDGIAGGASAIRTAAAAAAGFCRGPYARVTNLGAVLLVGEAGQGKTHLFCDLARRSLENGRPAILLMGQHFEARGGAWAQIARQIGIRGLGSRGALSALERLGRRRNCRVLLMIDALNEGDGLSLWPAALPELIKIPRIYPHVVIAVSCRSSYAGAVIPPRLRKSLPRFEHHGFAGVEADAVARFFAHYGLRHPAIPLLSPEFSRPLFLKLFCEGLRDRQAKTAPSGHRGMTDVLENFARSVGRRIVREMGHRELASLPWECLKSLASRMAQLGRDSLKRAEAEAVVAANVRGKLNNTMLFATMLDEGLLSEDIAYEAGKAVQVVRFPYQQFSDHLLARYLLTQHLDPQRPRACFEPGGALQYLIGDQHAVWRHSGVLNALAVQLPERTSFELLDLINDRRHEQLYRAHIQSIIWRRPDRFHSVPRVAKYVNEGARVSESITHEAWDALLTVAVVPAHPFNARALHATLRSKPLPVRDITWSRHLHRSWGPGSVVDRYLEWSNSVDAKSLPDEALLLAGIALAWFFTTSNRFIRDRSTKALVRILQDRFDVLSTLLDLFQGVNDLYVTERLLSAAYGCALLSDRVQPLAALAQKVHSNYLTGRNRQCHLLIRDYAEGIVGRAKAMAPLRFRTMKTRWQGWHARPPARIRLAGKYHHNYDPKYLSLWLSVMAEGDFDRYVIQPAIRQFTGYRLSEFVRRQVRADNAAEPAGMQLLLRQLAGETLSSEEEAALNRMRTATPVQPRNPKEHYDVDLARRWIFARVLSLGWTPERFYEFDRMVNYRDMREARKPERIGKKYQWIAFHELLGLLSDNYRWHPEQRSGDSKECPGGWAMGIRDIDPSHLRWSRPSPGPRPWWQPLPYALKPDERSRFTGWVTNRYWPDPRKLITSRDPNGIEWLVTEGHYEWRDLDAQQAGLDQPYRHVWYQLRCYLVRNAHVARMRRWLFRQDFMGRWMPESVSHHGEFIGEYPWHPSARSARQGWTRGWRGSQGPPVSVLVPAADLSWDDSFDASTDKSYSATVPATWLVAALKASWRPPFDYVMQSGRLVALDPSWHLSGPRVGLVRRPDFERVCHNLSVTPFWTLLGEKRVIEGVGRLSLPWREVSGTFEVRGDQVVGSLRQKLQYPSTQE
jgi:hypothetical protein